MFLKIFLFFWKQTVLQIKECIYKPQAEIEFFFLKLKKNHSYYNIAKKQNNYFLTFAYTNLKFCLQWIVVYIRDH